MNAYTPEEMAFLRQLDDLPNGLDLTPEQAAIVLGVDVDWLRKKRQQSAGAAPPFRSLGEGDKVPIRYPLGLLRDWQKGKVFVNTHAARMGLSGNFSGFLTTGMPNDTHPFSFDQHGRPLDYLTGDQKTPPALLTLSEYCDQLKHGARVAFSAFEEAELTQPPPPSPSEGQKKLKSGPGGPI